MKQERVNEIYGVLFLLLGLFLLIGLLFHDPSDHPFFTSTPNQPILNPTGLIGVYISHYLSLALGLSAYSIPFLFLFWSSCFFLQKVPNKKFLEITGILIAIFSFASILSLIVARAWKVKSGGLLGYFFASTLERYFGLAGGLIISFSCLMLATLLFTDFLLYPIFEKVWAYLHDWFRARTLNKSGKPSILKEAGGRTEKNAKAREKKEKEKEEEPRKTRFLEEVPVRLKQYVPEREQIEKEKKEKEKAELLKLREKPEKQKPVEVRPEIKKERDLAEISIKPDKKAGHYVFPSIDLLSEPPKEAVKIADDYQANSRILEETLLDFGVEVKVMEVEQGPVVTRYEILPAPGMKVTRILALSDDLALALKASSIRFIAPIPGKSAIGIEIPNSVTMKVYLRELIESKEFRQSKQQLPLTLGKDTSGKAMISDLSEMPHLLIAGTTGSGKTVCVNAIIAGLVYSKLPDNLKFVMIDPKMVELAIYNKLPHMLTPVVTDVRKAAATLNWVVAEMERRYRIFAQCGTRNIASFNNRPPEEEVKTIQTENGEEPIPSRLPYIVVIIDELADLMMVAQDKVESAITRLAQLSRAVGIHLILATQRPSVDVITGVIKANFPSRISFKVASKIDSRTVLDANGADKLIGKGDMLFLEPGKEKPIRGQAAYVSDEEINLLVKTLGAQGAPEYHQEIQEIHEGKASKVQMEKDELYDEAWRVIVETRQASISVLQRRLRLGYGRAARIIDLMEQEGLIGPLQGTKREIYAEKYETASSPGPTAPN